MMCWTCMNIWVILVTTLHDSALLKLDVVEMGVSYTSGYLILRVPFKVPNLFQKWAGHSCKNDIIHYQPLNQVWKSGIKTLLNSLVTVWHKVIVVLTWSWMYWPCINSVLPGRLQRQLYWIQKIHIVLDYNLNLKGGTWYR